MHNGRTEAENIQKLQDEIERLTKIINRLVNRTIKMSWSPCGNWAKGNPPGVFVGPYPTVLEAINAALKQEDDDG